MAKGPLDFWRQDTAEIMNQVDSYFADDSQDSSELPGIPKDSSYASVLKETAKRGKKAQAAAPEEDTAPSEEELAQMKQSRFSPISKSEHLKRADAFSQIEEARVRANTRASAEDIGPTVQSPIPTQEARYYNSLAPGTENASLGAPETEAVSVQPWEDAVTRAIGRGDRGESGATGYTARQFRDIRGKQANRTVQLLSPGIFPWGWAGPVEHK